MCGIAGFIGQSARVADAGTIARRMADAISRRGPDGEGVWTDNEAGIALAHRRLSIIDPSPAGHQPMVSESGRWVITFNGEIYNHAELRVELESAGLAPQWRGHCDTETFLAAISAWGIHKSLERSVGMFAFALWDRRERTLVLARDRIGEKPLYYGTVGSTFLFGSELSALRVHPDWDGEIDRAALCLLLRHNYIPTPHTVYKAIRKLPAGTYYVVRPSAGLHGTIETYWNAADAAAKGAGNPFQGSPSEAVERTDALVRQSLEGQMMADVPLGAFLSGGIDSSTVVALMQASSGRAVRTFSIGFNEEGYDEARYAKAVARHIGTDHTELYVTMKEAMAVVPQLPSLYNEPFADASQIPTFLVSKLARQHVTVALSGDGGDELFSGYTRYHLADRLWPFLSAIPQSLRRRSSHLIRRIAPAQYDRLLRQPMRLVPRRMRPQLVGDKLYKAANVVGLRSAAEVYLGLVSHWQHPEAVVIDGAEPPTLLTDVQGSAHADSVRRMMHLDLVGYLPDDVLAKVDRASMAVGLEARVPLLDHRLVEFTMSLPVSLLRHGGRSKWPLRCVLERYVPRKLVERPKMGFGVPIDRWLRGGLRDWAESLLDERRLAQEGFFRPEPIRAAWRQHLEGHRNLQYQLWGVLMFQAWNEAQRTAQPERPMAAAYVRA